MAGNETRNKSYSADRTEGGNQNKSKQVKNLKMDTNGFFFSLPLYLKRKLSFKRWLLSSCEAKTLYDTYLWIFNAFFTPGNVSIKV